VDTGKGGAARLEAGTPETTTMTNTTDLPTETTDTLTADRPLAEWTTEVLGEYCRHQLKITALGAWRVGTAITYAKKRLKKGTFGQWRKTYFGDMSEKTLQRFVLVALLKYEEVQGKKLVQVYRLLGLVGPKSGEAGQSKAKQKLAKEKERLRQVPEEKRDAEWYVQARMVRAGFWVGPDQMMKFLSDFLSESELATKLGLKVDWKTEGF
jgi:hypothetical protein